MRLLARPLSSDDDARRALAALAIVIAVYLVLRAIGLDPVHSLVARIDGEAAGSVVVATRATQPEARSPLVRAAPRQAPVATTPRAARSERPRAGRETGVRTIAQPRPRVAAPAAEPVAPAARPQPKEAEPEPTTNAPAPPPPVVELPDPPAIVPPPPTLPDPPKLPLPDPATLVDPGVVQLPPLPAVPAVPALP